MKPISMAFLVLVTTGLACAGPAAAGAHDAPQRSARDPAQARLSLPQAAVIAEGLGNGNIRKIEWKPSSEVYEVELATADGRQRKLLVEAYGGRLVDGSAR